jgi:uncharacterized protein YndB with AHSA1/START domain
MAKIPTIEHVYAFRARPERVFAALTQEAELTKWFSRKARVELRKGGPFRLTWDAGTMKGKVKSFDPPKRLVVAWHDRIDGKTYDTEARFDLKRKGTGTLLHLSHSGFKSGKAWIWLYGAIQSGWAYYLTNLRSVLEHGTDLRSEQDSVQ